LISLERRYLRTVNVKLWLHDKIVGFTDFDKTHRNVSYLYAVLKVMNYGL